MIKKLMLFVIVIATVITVFTPEARALDYSDYGD